MMDTQLSKLWLPFKRHDNYFDLTWAFYILVKRRIKH